MIVCEGMHIQAERYALQSRVLHVPVSEMATCRSVTCFYRLVTSHHNQACQVRRRWRRWRPSCGYATPPGAAVSSAL